MFFCRHDWEVKDKTVLPSAWEQHKATHVETATLPVWFFMKKAVITLACKKCGKLKVVRESSP